MHVVLYQLGYECTFPVLKFCMLGPCLVANGCRALLENSSRTEACATPCRLNDLHTVDHTVLSTLEAKSRGLKPALGTPDALRDLERIRGNTYYGTNSARSVFTPPQYGPLS